MDQEMDEHRKQEPKEQFTETEFPMANNLQLDRPYFSCAANGRNVMRTSSRPRFQGFSLPPRPQEREKLCLSSFHSYVHTVVVKLHDMGLTCLT